MRKPRFPRSAGAVFMCAQLRGAFRPTKTERVRCARRGRPERVGRHGRHGPAGAWPQHDDKHIKFLTSSQDLFSQLFGGGGFFGGGGPSRNAGPRKTKDLVHRVNVTLEDLYKGKTTKFSNTKNVICTTCKGSGGKQGAKSHACGMCGGRGMPHLLSTRFEQY